MVRVFGSGLVLELRGAIFLGGNCPRTVTLAHQFKDILVYELKRKVHDIYTFINSRYICYSLVDTIIDKVTRYRVNIKLNINLMLIKGNIFSSFFFLNICITSSLTLVQGLLRVQWGAERTDMWSRLERIERYISTGNQQELVTLNIFN